MKNHEIQTLVHRKGLDNEVTLKGSDVQRLLDVQMPYDFCMKFVQEVAAYPWTPEIAKEEFAEHEQVLKRSWDHVVKGGLPARMSWALLRLRDFVDQADSLTCMYPAPSWDNIDERH